MPIFQPSKQKDMRTEVIAGLTTFMASMYIIIVNPAILSATGMPFNAVVTATVVVSAFSSILMGIYAKNPILVAPGMGLNAFFAYSVVSAMKIRWEVALGAVFWSGILFLVLSLLNVRSLIVKSIPKQIRYGVSVGIGLFISLIGFSKAGFIVANPSTIIGFGGINIITIIFIAGLFITAVLIQKQIKAALVLGIIITTCLSIPINRWFFISSLALKSQEPLVSFSSICSWPDFSLFMQLDLINSLKFALWPVIFAFLFTDLFDSLSTFIGVAEAADLLDEDGEPKNIKESLIVDSFSTIISGLFGTSAGTSYIESAAGTREGGKTGLTAVIAGVLFLPFMFLSPLLSVIPDIATAPALIFVGVYMMKPILKINWEKFDDAFPAFLAVVLIPFSYSISQGIIWSFISWTILKIISGKKNEVSKTLVIIDFFAIISLFISK